MILIDRREKNARELASIITRVGVKAEIVELPYGDFAFDGFNGITVGIERKRLHDMLHCIDDARFSAHQRMGLRALYTEHYLLLEGYWRPHDPKGVLMEGDGSKWWECKPGGRPVLYSKLRRYLLSVQRAGTPVIYTRDVWHTCYDVCELYHYYQKKTHDSMKQIHKPGIAQLNGKPSVTRQWAEALEGVGSTFGEQAERLFKTPVALANSEEVEWLAIRGIGKPTAQNIMAQLEGKRRR